MGSPVFTKFLGGAAEKVWLIAPLNFKPNEVLRCPPLGKSKGVDICAHDTDEGVTRNKAGNAGALGLGPRPRGAEEKINESDVYLADDKSGR